MAMVDMMRDKPDETAGPECMPCASGQQYPYGLNLRLDAPELKKLGITQMPAVGSEVKVQFVGVVTSCSHGLNEHDEAGMSVQIVQMECTIEAQPAARQETTEHKPAGSYRPKIVE